MELSNTISTVQLSHGQTELRWMSRGGALVECKVKNQSVNPLSFEMSSEPGGGYYRGHFLCAPRWGEPGLREEAAGLRKHGDLRELDWTLNPLAADSIEMSVHSVAEQLVVVRKVVAMPGTACWYWEENIQNVSNDNRRMNLVQHPTLGRPFLNADTRVDASVTTGYRYRGLRTEPEQMESWPANRRSDGTLGDLREATAADAGVYSYPTAAEKLGWITALDPHSQQLIGYCWSAARFPWIHHWIHELDGELLYRGLEFGTAPLHQPIDFLEQQYGFDFAGRPLWFELGAGEWKQFPFYFWCIPLPRKASAVKNIVHRDGRFYIQWTSAIPDTVI